jgi:hypothetical protein
MDKCSTRPTVTPSGSRSEARRMHAQRVERVFRSGKRSHFQVGASTRTICRMRRRRCLSFPFNSTSWFFRALWPFRHGGPIVAAALFCRRKCQTKKTPPSGATARRGVVGARGGRRVTIHRAELRDAFIKGGGCRYDSRLWNPEIALSTLTSSHAFCHAARPGGSPRAQHLLRRRARNGQTTWMTPRPAPP